MFLIFFPDGVAGRSYIDKSHPLSTQQEILKTRRSYASWLRPKLHDWLKSCSIDYSP